MNIEKDWPTLIEASRVKSAKKKYNIKKKGACVKINPGLNFIKGDNFVKSSQECRLNENVTNLNIGSKCYAALKGIENLQVDNSPLIQNFDNKNEELYNYHEDSSLNFGRQRSMCKQLPSKNNMASTMTNDKVNDMYYEFLNEYLLYVNSERNVIYQDVPLYTNKIEDSTCKSKSLEKITSHPIDDLESEIMYVRGNVLSYYFSETNLYNDKYLVSIMDEDGWIDLDALLKFPRLLKTKTNLQDVQSIAKSITYPAFHLIVKNSLSEAVLELKLENFWKIRRSDMTKFRTSILAFSNENEYKPRPHKLPYPKYTYSYFLNNLDNVYSSRFKDEKIEGSYRNYDWTEVKPKVRRSRKSESCAMESQNNLNVDNQDNFDFEFSSEPNPLQSRNNLNLRRKQTSRRSMERSRSRTISGGSDDELDESNIYILSMRPKMISTKILDWADVNDSDDDSNIPISSSTQSKISTISQRLLAKHPSGDRHPNPDYQPRSKIQEQLREIISEGLIDWKNNNEVIRRNRRDSSSSTSSDIKVQMCQDEKTFKLMQKSLQNYENIEVNDEPTLPTSIIPIEHKVEVMKQKTVNVMVFKPLPEEISTIDCDLLVESSTSSLLNPVHYDSWNPPFTITNSLNQLLDKLLENVQYEYLNIDNSLKYRQNKESVQNIKTNNVKQAKISNESPLIINDVRKEIRKTKRSCKVGFYPVTKVGPAKDKQKDKTRASNNPVEECDVGYAYSGRQINSRRQRTISGSTYNQYNDAGYAVAHGIPIPFNDHPSQLLLQENGFEIKFYNVFRKESLADREKKGIGRSQEMNTLFRFWSFFLRENKNRKMYEEFQKYAWEDALKGYRYGVECLFRMYTYKLEQRRYFNEQQYQDFQKNVLKDLESSHLYGLEKFWAFLKYSSRKIEIHPRIKKLLEKYKTLDDFRSNFIPPQGFHSYKIEYHDQTAVESGIESE